MVTKPKTRPKAKRANYLDEESQEKLRLLHKFCHGRPRARRTIRSLAPNADVQVGAHLMHLYPQDNYTDYRLWMDRVAPENASITLLEEAIAGKRALVLDIGANCGSYTLRLATAAGPKAHILAFEPNPVMFKRLKHNLKLNELQKRVEVKNIALGASQGKASLSLRPGNYGEATLIQTKRPAPSVEVDVMPIEGFFKGAREFEIIVVKIDVEGHEDAVFEDFFSRVDPADTPHLIMIETRHREVWGTDLCAIFEAQGYAPVFEGEGNTLYSRISR